MIDFWYDSVLFYLFSEFNFHFIISSTFVDFSPQLLNFQFKFVLQPHMVVWEQETQSEELYLYSTS